MTNLRRPFPPEAQDRHERWSFEAARNDDIRRRVSAGQTVAQVAQRYGLSTTTVLRIMSLSRGDA